MNDKTSTAEKAFWWTRAALGAVLALAVAGCNCITINVGQPLPVGSAQPPPAPRPPGGAGGNFVPVQASATTGGSLTICNQPVSGTYVRFYPPTQYPNPGDTGFRGYLWNATTGSTIPNTHYYLQWFVTIANTGCCTPVAGSTTDVSCPVTAGSGYRFTAHFKSGYAPPAGTQVTLQGAWTQ